MYSATSSKIEEVIETLEFHTTEFSTTERDILIEAIIERVQADYPERSIDSDRLRKGILAAHAAKPIRLIALLHSCALDFPTDVIMGIYRHYDPRTNTMRNGWTAQHAEPHTPSFLELLLSGALERDDEEEDADEYEY